MKKSVFSAPLKSREDGSEKVFLEAFLKLHTFKMFRCKNWIFVTTVPKLTIFHAKGLDYICQFYGIVCTIAQSICGEEQTLTN